MICPHCGKDTTQSPQELVVLDRIGKLSRKIIKKVTIRKVKP